MADAMCGPSNPLQQFRKQGDIDRTLQQDRLTSRNQAADGFRSHNPNATSLDSEFDAFQAGVRLPVPDFARPFPKPAGFDEPSLSQAPPWASDFQRLQISAPSVQQHQHAQATSSAATWAQDFSTHLARSAPKAQSSHVSPLTFQQQARGFGSFGYQNHFAQPVYAPATQSKGKEPVNAEQFDDSAFERAFQQARADLMAEVEEPEQEEAELQDVQDLVENIEAAAEQGATQMLNESNQDFDAMHPMEQMHTNDIEYQPQPERLETDTADARQREEDDALAATAQELLAKVEHNQSDKFKNSHFLGLMRKLADRQVRVEGDQMVETADASAMSVADDTLNAPSTVNAQRVYYGKPQPVPLAATIDSRPPDSIPLQEQDHDMGRIDPNDGQEVVDLLNERGAITDDIDSEFLMTSPYYQP